MCGTCGGKSNPHREQTPCRRQGRRCLAAKQQGSNSPRHGLQKGLINMRQARGRLTGRKAGATGHRTQKPTQENCRVYLWHKMLRHNQRPTLAGNNRQQREQIVGWNCCISTRASLLISWSALIQVMLGLGLWQQTVTGRCPVSWLVSR